MVNPPPVDSPVPGLRAAAPGLVAGAEATLRPQQRGAEGGTGHGFLGGKTTWQMMMTDDSNGYFLGLFSRDTSG